MSALGFLSTVVSWAKTWPIAWTRRVVRRPRRLLAVISFLVIIGAIVGLTSKYVKAAYHGRVGRQELERFHSAAAAAHFRDYLAVWPRDPTTLLLAARAARRIAAFDEAQRYLDARKNVSGTDDDDLILEQVLLRAERGEMDQVQRFCQVLRNQDHPDTPLILEALSRGYLRMFRLGEAEKCVEEWLQRQPTNVQAFLTQGLLFDQSGRLTDAIDSYRRAVQLDPERDEARLRLAGLLVHLHQDAEAAPHLEYLQKRQPADPQVWLLSARCQDQFGRQEEAERLLDEALKREPGFGPALAERGRLALQQGDNLAAEDWLRQAVAVEPGDYEVHYQFYLALQRNHKAEEASAEQGRMDQIQDDMKRIQEIVTRDMPRRPHDAALHYEAGMIALRAGSVAEGLRWLQSAVTENPRYAPAHRALAEYYRRTGSPGRATRHRQLAEQGAAGSSGPAPSTEEKKAK
jgi:tetratricopeptide (TPR) repeat protein